MELIGDTILPFDFGLKIPKNLQQERMEAERRAREAREAKVSEVFKLFPIKLPPGSNNTTLYFYDSIATAGGTIAVGAGPAKKGGALGLAVSQPVTSGTLATAPLTELERFTAANPGDP